MTTQHTAYLATLELDEEPCSGLMIQADPVGDDGEVIVAGGPAGSDVWLPAPAVMVDSDAADELLTAHGWARVTPWHEDFFGQLSAVVERTDPRDG